MPKLKTKKAFKKRFKFTKTGKIKRYKAGKSHILTKKSRKRKKWLRRPTFVSKGMERSLKRLMPYG